MCYQSSDADCISIYEIIRIPQFSCIKNPKNYIGAVLHYIGYEKKKKTLS